MKKKLYSYMRLLRIGQWIKNLIIFAPLFFGGNLFNVQLLMLSVLAFFSFCFLSSAVYCLNDIIDVAKDRIHPTKKKRPLATGEVGVCEASALMAVCVALAAIIALFTDERLLLILILAGYLLINIAYCLRLKQTAIIDVTCISVGFLLRLLAGGVVTGIILSQWLLLMTYLLALFLALTKRYDDLLITEDTGVQMRTSIMGYNRSFLSVAMTIAATVMLVCYIMYTMSPEVVERMGSRYVLLTSVWVLTAVLRFLQIAFVFNNSGSPTRIIMSDYFVWFCFIGWLLTFFYIIYRSPIT